MATQQSNKENLVIDTAGGEMPNPNAPGHGPTQGELESTLNASRTNKSRGEQADEQDQQSGDSDMNKDSKSTERSRDSQKH